MSSDKEDRGPVRRPRVIKRPYVPPGRLADLKALIYELYLAAGTPTLDEITNGVDRSGGDLAGNPGRDTINRIIGDPGMPASQADVVAVVTVLAREAYWDVEDAVRRARDLWVAAQMDSARYPASGIRVGQADPRRLGVHVAISVPGVPDEVPPEYVPRDTDDGELGVRAKVAAAAERGGFVLLVGGSSVGKTRSAVEAVRALLPDWWLVHPAGPGEVGALAAAQPRRVVVWLDELQRYLDGEQGLTGGVVRALLNAPHPVVIIGTIWPDWYTAYITLPGPGGADPHARERADSHAREREVLDLADVVRIDSEFSPAEQGRTRTAAARDRRLAVALETAGYGLTQTLAAAPQLVARWQDARTAAPYAWAVLTAALDAARLGARAPLSRDFLRAAAPGYLTGEQQAEAPKKWFKQARAYATAKLHGAAAALTPVGSGIGQVDGYTVADYLIQHASRERHSARVPASTWDAALGHIRDPADTARLADAARDRLLYRYAIPLYRRAAGAGDGTAARQLAGLLAQRDDLDGAKQILRAWADAGDEDAAWQLAELLAEHGDLDGLRARADAGDEGAAVELAGLLAQRDDLTGPEQILRARAGAGDRAAPWQLAELLADRGDLDGLRALAGAGDKAAVSWLATLLADHGDLDEAEQILRARADAGDKEAARQLATLLADHGDLDEAEQILRALADTGNKAAASQLAELLGDRGDLDGLRARAGAGDEAAARQLAWRPDGRGELDRPEQRLRARAGAGDKVAAGLLAKLLGDRGDVAGLRARADAGDEAAVRGLAWLLAKHGDLDEAEQILRGAADEGDGIAAVQLARLREQRGDLDEAQQILRARADAGDKEAARQLAKLLIRQGRGDEAERLRRFGLNPDGSIAWA